MKILSITLFIMSLITILLHILLIVRQKSISKFFIKFFVGHFEDKDKKIFNYCQLFLLITIVIYLFYYRVL